MPSATQAANTPLPVRFTNVDHILISVRVSEIPLAIRQITGLLRERHRLRPEEPDDFNIRDMTEMTKTLASTSTLMTNLLLSVALISLIVGGVGIMNIMLVSVTERTREIGLRMAVGARARDILRQFLVEAVVLCLAGGAIGILLGCGGSYLVTLLLQLADGNIAARYSDRSRRFRQRGHNLSGFTRHGRPRGLTRSKPCAMNERGNRHRKQFILHPK